MFQGFVNLVVMESIFRVSLISKTSLGSVASYNGQSVHLYGENIQYTYCFNKKLRSEKNDLSAVERCPLFERCPLLRGVRC